MSALRRNQFVVLTCFLRGNLFCGSYMLLTRNTFRGIFVFITSITLRDIYEETQRGHYVDMSRGLYDENCTSFYEVIFPLQSTSNWQGNICYDERITTKLVSSLIPRKSSFTRKSRGKWPSLSLYFLVVLYHNMQNNIYSAQGADLNYTVLSITSVIVM